MTANDGRAEHMTLEEVEIADLAAKLAKAKDRIREIEHESAHWEHKYTNARQYNRNLEERCKQLEAALRDLDPHAVTERAARSPASGEVKS